MEYGELLCSKFMYIYVYIYKSSAAPVEPLAKLSPRGTPLLYQTRQHSLQATPQAASDAVFQVSAIAPRTPFVSAPPNATDHRADATRSFFKTLVDHEVTVELKNDISIRGTLKSVDQYLNIKLDDIQVVEELKYPHLVRCSVLWWMVDREGEVWRKMGQGMGAGPLRV